MKPIVFITGASSGFGEACAKLLSENNFPLIITGRRADRLEKLANELSKNAPVLPLAFDIREKKTVLNAISSIPSKFSEIGILINNAGLALGTAPADKAELEDWETMVDTNIKGLMYCTHAILPRMVKRSRGQIINIGSIAANWPYPGGNVYGATKSFVAQFSLNLRADLIDKNIRVTDIQPGLAETEFSIVRYKGNKDLADKVYKNTIPLIAKDIAEIVHYVCTLPEHININSLEVMPTCQAWGPFAIYKSGN